MDDADPASSGGSPRPRRSGRRRRAHRRHSWACRRLRVRRPTSVVGTSLREQKAGDDAVGQRGGKALAQEVRRQSREQRRSPAEPRQADGDVERRAADPAVEPQAVTGRRLRKEVEQGLAANQEHERTAGRRTGATRLLLPHLPPGRSNVLDLPRSLIAQVAPAAISRTSWRRLPRCSGSPSPERPTIEAAVRAATAREAPSIPARVPADGVRSLSRSDAPRYAAPSPTALTT